MKNALRIACLSAPLAGAIILVLGAFHVAAPIVTAFVLMAVIMAAVVHAETVAHRVGEPFGTLILAIAVTVIEVGLIVSLMLADPGASTALARDTVFAAAMIILNLLLGLCLIGGAKHQRQERFTRTGATAALGTLATLLVLSLVLPNFTTSAAGPIYTPAQLAYVATFSLAGYLTYIFVQTVSNRDYFLPSGSEASLPDSHAAPPSDRDSWIAFAALIGSLIVVVLMAKSLSSSLETAIAAAGAPRELVGIVIAGIVLLPEGIAAVRAARANRLQTSLNLTLGSALATIGLTIPAVAATSFVLGLPLTLGLEAKGIVLLALTLFVSAISLARGRTTVLHGAIHLVIFAAYLMTTIIP